MAVELPEKLAFLFEPARYKVIKGGRGSGKSWGVARALLINAGKKPTRILCTREVQKSIQQSVHQLLKDQIEAMGLGAFYEVLQTTIRGKNGSEFFFAGLSDLTVDSIKSFEGVDIVWCEEAQTISDRSSCLIGGIPILNNGVDLPQQWLLTGKATALSAWPTDHTCAVMRTYKNSLIALNITKAGVNFPFMVKWSHPADPGSVPVTWDIADATKDAGEADLSDGYDRIVDGLALRDSFMIYKETSVWRMDFTGGAYIYRFQKVLGASGALSKNCIAELDGVHFVLSSSDCIVHDGQTATSVLDKQTRRDLFRQIDQDNSDKCFVFVNRLYNEVFVCYPSLGHTRCNKALVWNFVDKTVSFRDLPDLNHAYAGAVDDFGGATWPSDSDVWDADTTLWDGVQSSLTRTLSTAPEPWCLLHREALPHRLP